MALKDWKRIESTRNQTTYRHQTTGEDVQITSALINRKDRDTEFVVDIGLKKLLTKSFKKKSQALSYAKRYMRAN